MLKTLVGHSGEVNAVAFRRDSTTLASAGADSAVRLWDVASGQQIGVLTGHQAAVRAVVFSRNGKLLASAGEDARILVWDVATGKLLNTLQTNNGAINALLFLPSGRLLSADESGQISEWDVGTFRKLKSVKPSRQPRVQAKALSSLQDGVPALGAFAYDESRDGGSTDAGQHNHGVAADIVGRLLDWLIPAASAATLPDPNLGPGGPILVVTSSSLDGKYGKYYAEILRTEGLNEFSVMDIGSITAVTLSAYDVVILAPATLSADQVTMFGDWVNAGGNLIAMRPAPQLASLLGLTAAGSTLSDRYLLVDTSKAPGAGIVGQSIQFHGTADLYTLNGASSVATLYADATTVTPNPAVTVRSVGGTGGQAAAFAYDLATSIVEMRQGNPAWATEERDGSAPIRSDDKFYGDAATDPQPDWVDLAKVAIPQADEQQRLLANLILYMNLDKKPLPRFWYFPNGKKAVVIMTGDDHGNGGTAGRFDQYLAASPSGCTVANWECVRATSYIYVELPYLSDTEAKSYTDQGFEVGLHLNTNCADYDATSLNAFYSDQVSGFTSAYLSIPAPITQRHHCIAWSDWITGAKTQFNYGMRLDTSYYFWPPGWVQDRPGVFTGSAMPMRFADLDGTIIDVYNTTTQMTDESGQTYPNTSDVLLSAALGPQGYYGAYTVNAHTDLASNPVSDAVVASALGRGVPIVSSRQMMDWLDFRNSSSFQGLGWSGNSLSFNVAPGIATQDIPAAGLQVLLPVNSTAGLLADITRDGASIPYANETVKGVAYAAFPGAAGAYVATYGVDTTPPTMTATSPANGATGVFAGTTVTATFSEAVDATTVSSATVTLQGPSGAVGAAVSYNAATSTATLTPSATLAASTTYTATVTGGTTGVKDLAGNALAADVAWTFTTAATPVGCTGGSSLWADTVTPALAAISDGQAIEVGVKFRSNVNGYICGIRFYKGSANTGAHVGTLWDSTGQALASATFTNETASGWQQVSFAAPVAISANTVYVASYHSSGYFAYNSGYFTSAGVDSGPLHALSVAESGGNGVYQYAAASAFPTGTYQGGNYWVDVVFTTSASPDTTAPTVTMTAPGAGATVSGTAVTVSANASDNVGVTSVQFLLDGVALGSADTSAPYSITWNSTTAANGAHTLSARASDAAGNTTTATGVAVTVSNVVDTTPPTVTAQTPAAGATGVATGTTVTATFSEAVDATTVSSATVTLQGPSGAVGAAVSYNAATRTATLTPSATLAASTTYTATVTGGATGVKDLAGNALAADVAWTFTTAATPVGCTGGSSLWADTVTPALAAISDGQAIEVGVKFRSNVNGYICGIRFYKGSANTGAHVGTLWDSTGRALASATFTNETASGWQQVSFAAPVAISANAVYVASYHSSGYFAYNSGYFTSAGVDSGPLHALSVAESGGNGVYQYAATSAFPTGTYQGANYWVDVVFTTSVGADTTAPTVTMTAPGAGATVSGTAVTVSANASDNVGVTSVQFLLDGVALGSADTSAPYSITWNSTTAANGAHTLSARASDAAGNTTTATGVAVTVSNVADTTPPTVTAQTPAAGAAGVATGTTVTATFSEAVDATTVSSATVTLQGPSGAVGAAVSYNAATSTATLTPSATLAASTTYTATVKGGATGVKDLAGNALAADVAWTFTTAATPVGCTGGSSLWADTVTPALAAISDGQAIEVGVKFRSNVNGYICGIRFYKGSANTGAHVGTLWDSTGQALASATFTNETASGWQQVSFAAPVAISANAVYVASYHSSGYFAYNSGYFTSAGVDSGPLHALSVAESGGNGVYQYAATSAFPTGTYQGANYWVDVVFTTSVGADTTAPTVSSTSPANGATGVGVSAPVTVRFSEMVDPTTVSSATVTLQGPGGAVAATVSYASATSTASLTPSAQLALNTTYTATVKGGASGVKDLAGNALGADVTWSFTTVVTDPCATGNPIVQENCKPGNPPSEWDVSGVGDTSIQGFATDISVDRGETVDFKIQTNATSYSLDIYRMGYYGGLGARKVATVQPSATLPQNQPACLTNAATKLVDCGNWAVSGIVGGTLERDVGNLLREAHASGYRWGEPHRLHRPR